MEEVIEKTVNGASKPNGMSGSQGMVLAKLTNGQEFRKMKLKKISYQEVRVNFEHAKKINKHVVEHGNGYLHGGNSHDISHLCTNGLPWVIELISMHNGLQENENLLAIFANLSTLPKKSHVQFLIGDELDKWNLAREKCMEEKQAGTNNKAYWAYLNSSDGSNELEVSESPPENQLNTTDSQKSSSESPQISPRILRAHLEKLADEHKQEAIDNGKKFVNSALFQFGLKLLKDKEITVSINSVHELQDTTDKTYREQVLKLLENDGEFKSRFDIAIDNRKGKIKDKQGIHYDRLIADMSCDCYLRDNYPKLLQFFKGIATQIKETNREHATCITYPFTGDLKINPDIYVHKKLMQLIGLDIPMLRTLHTRDKPYTLAGEASPKISRKKIKTDKSSTGDNNNNFTRASNSSLFRKSSDENNYMPMLVKKGDSPETKKKKNEYNKLQAARAKLIATNIRNDLEYENGFVNNKGGSLQETTNTKI